MYYRVAIQPPSTQTWEWKSTALASLNTLVQWLLFHRALPRDRLRVFSASSREALIEQLARENRGALLAAVPAAYYLPEDRGSPASAVCNSMLRLIPRAVELEAAPRAAQYSALEADFTPDEMARLVALRQQVRTHPDRSDVSASMRRLEFARWLVEHGKLNEGWEPDGVQASQPCRLLSMLAC